MFMLLKKIKVIHRQNIGLIRFIRHDVRVSMFVSCEQCLYQHTEKCLSPRICGKYIVHQKISSKIIKSLNYRYLIEQKYVI